MIITSRASVSVINNNNNNNDYEYKKINKSISFARLVVTDLTDATWLWQPRYNGNKYSGGPDNSRSHVPAQVRSAYVLWTTPSSGTACTRAPSRLAVRVGRTCSASINVRTRERYKGDGGVKSVRPIRCYL